jgi:hypothetical protein
MSGHSFLPNDRDFGIVEMAIRKTNFLYVPEDYYKLIAQCHKKKNKFSAHQMKHEHFLHKTSRECCFEKVEKF